MNRFSYLDVARGSNRKFGLDLMRFAAIEIVVVYHGLALLRAFFPQQNTFRVLGWIGVDLFFVLSGFLIGGILIRILQNEFTIGRLFDFWKRRWYRTLPNYFLFLILNFALALIWNIGVEGRLPSIVPYLFFTQNMAHSPPALFNESWSLSVEEWFYLISAGSLFFSVKLIRNIRTACLVVIVAMCVVPLLLRFNYVVAVENIHWHKAVRKVVLFRFDSIAYGVLFAWFKFYFPDRWDRSGNVIPVFGFLTMISAVGWYLNVHPDESRLSSIVLTALFAIGAASILPFLDQLQKSKWNETPLAEMVTASSIYSYSMYLINIPLVLVTSRWLPGSLAAGGVGAVSIFVGYMILVHMLSCLLFKYFEEPMMRLRRAQS